MGRLIVFIRISVLTVLCFCNTFSYTQTYNKNISDYILNVQHPYAFLQRIEKIGIKEPGLKGLDSAYRWLVKTIEQTGYKTTTQKFAYNQDTLRNIEFIKKGENDSCIIIGAHYDSKGGPGVNDNGTGNFALFQIAKWIKNLKTKYTLRFVYFSGEEIDYLGSKHYVKNLNRDSVKIKFMFNLDQLGGTIGENNSGIKCERDESSPNKDLSNSLTNVLAKCMSLYTNLMPSITPAYLSDYVSFRDSGYVITGLYQYANFPYHHSESDLLINIELASLQSAVKGALAFILVNSVAEVPVGINTLFAKTLELNVYTTANNLVSVSNSTYTLQVYDQYGRLILGQVNLNHENKIPLDGFKNGLYYAYISTPDRVLCKKFLVKP